MQNGLLKFCLAAFTVSAAYFLIRYAARPEPIKVTLSTVEYGQVESTIANTRVGTVKACRRAFLSAASGGQVARLNVKEGQRVKSGQVLMEVWNNDLQAKVDLEFAENKSVRARAKEACVLAEGAEREASRQLNLEKLEQIVSKVQVDSAVTDAKAKRAACNAVTASIRVNEARIKEAEARLDRTRVRAPFNGTIAEINVELGEYVTPSPPGIATLPAIDLLDLSCLYVSAPIDEVDAPAIETGMKACVSLDAFEQRRCSGKVTRIAPYVLEKEKQARTLEVEVTITDPKDLLGLLPGYSADIEISLNLRERTLRIPTEAVLDGNRVLVADGNYEVSERHFESGISNWQYTEVVSGLEAGEKIILSIGRAGVVAGANIVED